MEDKLRQHIDALFSDAPRNRKTLELKEEMLQNLTEKYNDLITEGKSEEAAFGIAVTGIGDVTELIVDLEEFEMADLETHEKARQKSALLTAVAVMLYILSPISGLVFDWFGENWSAVGFLITVAAATGILVYNNMTKPKYIRKEDTMVEEFREWQSEKSDRKTLRRAISMALWSVTVALYFVISFTTTAWHITWVVFVVAAAAEAFINIIFITKK